MAKIFGHPIHQMLVVFPLGLLGTAVAFDILGLAMHQPMWTTMAFYLIGAGILGGLCAAVFGLVDYLSIPPATRAKHIGGWHGAGNVIVVLLFGSSFYLRWDNPALASMLALTLSFVGLALALVTGWLGGELVDRLGVGVDDGANPNAPSSLSHRRVPSTERDAHPRLI